MRNPASERPGCPAWRATPGAPVTLARPGNWDQTPDYR